MSPEQAVGDEHLDARSDLYSLGCAGPSVSALGAAQTYGALGDFDRAFEWLDRAYDDHDWALFFARSDPLLVPLHRDPRWARFIARMSFP